MTNTNWLKALQKHGRELSFFEKEKDYRKWLKREYKEHGRYAAQRDKLAHGISDGVTWQRTRFDEDGEGWRTYGILKAYDIIWDYDDDLFNSFEDALLDLSDDELRGWFEDNMAVRPQYDHDCSGRAFTQWIHWHVNPDCTVSFVHKMALDV